MSKQQMIDWCNENLNAEDWGASGVPPENWVFKICMANGASEIVIASTTGHIIYKSEFSIFGEQDVCVKGGSKYNRKITNSAGESMIVDVYDVLEAFAVTCPALSHLAKKSLCAGLRGHKDKNQDLDDIVASANRAVELNKGRNCE